MIVALKWIAGRALRLIPERFVGMVLPGALRFRLSDIPPPPVPPNSSIRLYVGPVNWAGQGWQWARAAQDHVDGVGAVDMAYRSGPFGFRTDNPVPLGVYTSSRRWQRAQYGAVQAGFTHVLVEAERQPFGAVLDESVAFQVHKLAADGLVVGFVCHGSDIRLPSRHAGREPDSPFVGSILARTASLERDARRNRRMLDRLGFPVFVSTPDLLLDVPYATWLPVIVDAAAWKTSRRPLAREVPVVAHAPSHGAIKGSELIDPMLRRLANEGLIEYRRVEGIAAAEMPDIYGDADIVLDQFRIGDYGVAACEAMAAGCVVIGHVSDHAREHVVRATGLVLPIVESRAADLEALLRRILRDRVAYQSVASTGPDFIADVHSGERSAKVLAPFLGRRSPRPADVAADAPTVDVIIPVHSEDRPIVRAVSSVLGRNRRAKVTITIVCHNLRVDAIARALGPELVAQVRLLELADGVASPAGPKNHGLASTNGEFVVFLDSDDALEEGAIDYWVKMAEHNRLGAVIANERFSGGQTIRTPPTRPRRTVALDPIRDRLAYRTAPLGLLRRSALTQLHLTFTPGLASGEDQGLSTQLWFSGQRIGFARRGPAYLVGEDAHTRVTMASRAIAEDLRALDDLVAQPWFDDLSLPARHAVVTRIVRVHLFALVLRRSASGYWSTEDGLALASVLVRLSRAAPGYERVFSRADRGLLDVLLAGDAEAQTVLALASARRRFGRPATLLTRDLRAVLARDAPLRFILASLTV